MPCAHACGRSEGARHGDMGHKTRSTGEQEGEEDDDGFELVGLLKLTSESEQDDICAGSRG